MARYRKIDPRIHNDGKYKALSERGKLFFFTILTHPHMTSLGAMRATEAGLCEEMALGASGKDADCPADCASDCPAGRAAGVLESYRQAFRDLIKNGLIKFDPSSACLVVPNFLRYNPPESPSVVTAWNAAGDLIPECALRDELIENTINFLEGYDKPSFLEAFKLRSQNGHPEGQAAPQTEGQSAPQQEQEQELNTPPNPPGGTDEGKVKKKKKTVRQLTSYSPEFLKFYEAYPNKKGGKEKAWAIWQRRLKKRTLPPMSDLMESLYRLTQDRDWMKEDGQFVPMVTTFLNSGRWTDVDNLVSGKKAPSDPPDPDCPYCKGRGLEPAEKDGVKGMTMCRCRRKEQTNK